MRTIFVRPVWRRRRVWLIPVKPGIAGVANFTLGAVTVAATGVLDIAGAASVTLGAVTVAATGALDIAGTASFTLGATTVSATGALDIAATASFTLGATTVAATGTTSSEITGAANFTLGAVTAAATGALDIAGAASFTLGAATTSATGKLDIAGAASFTLGAATCDATATSGGGAAAVTTRGISIVRLRKEWALPGEWEEPIEIPRSLPKVWRIFRAMEQYTPMDAVAVALAAFQPYTGPTLSVDWGAVARAGAQAELRETLIKAIRIAEAQRVVWNEDEEDDDLAALLA